MLLNKAKSVKTIIFIFVDIVILLSGIKVLAQNNNDRNIDTTIYSIADELLSNDLAVDKPLREEKLNQYYKKLNQYYNRYNQSNVIE